MRYGFVAWCLLIAGVSVSAQAQTPGAAPAYPVEIVHQYFTDDVNADGTYTHTVDQLFVLKTQQGVQTLRTALVAYSESLQEGDLLEVYTIKPDGKRIDVPLDQVQTRSAPMSMQAPMFDDIKIKALAFQNVEVGDEVGAVARVRQKTPLIPGQYSMAHTFGRGQPQRDVRLVVTAPKDGFPLHVDAVGLDNKPPAVVDGRYQWTWTFKNDEPQAAEPGSVGEFDVAPHVVMSSLADYAALAKAYESRAHDKAAVTPPIKELADKLTEGTHDRREQVRRLYEWVSKNVAYVAINLGVGAIVPHGAADVLANLYGDCKDHVTLLQSLLKVKGIDSTPALINAGDSFKTSNIASLQQFNHVITYIPELKLYLNSTARYAPFGVLPFQDADKTVLLTVSGKLDHTPWDIAATNFHTATTLTVHDDGSADGETRISATGPLAVSMRNSVGNIPPQQEQNFLRQVLGDSGDGSLDRGAPDSLADPYQFGMHFKLPNYLQIPGPGAISFSQGPRLMGRVPVVASMEINPHQRDFICPSGHYVDEMTIELPAAVKISSLPKPQDAVVEGLKLATTYVQVDEHTIKATRTLDIAEPRRFCSAERGTRLHADFVKMNGLLGAQALYE